MISSSQIKLKSIFPRFAFHRFCVCTVCMGTHKLLQALRSHLQRTHTPNCLCDCPICSSGQCRPAALDVYWIQRHFLCARAPLLKGSDKNYYPWECLRQRCGNCFLRRDSIFSCPLSGFTANNRQMKWEKWEKKDYTQHNLSSQGHGPRGVGIPLRTAPEAPKKKKT